ncbi:MULTISPECIES: hypothetical protein [Klebsiella]|uniref:hypothetical protein n=1 Tax=Klebsiella TaxID=570 RepID=UPI001E2A7114|nr:MULTISPECIES: hypothetical protein [Klebsiella]MEC6161444.1 hypothetical protein [Klebsiella grimontii]UHD01756.1 hypothetical protein LUW96_12300 [Klebsiella pasteurii]
MTLYPCNPLKCQGDAIPLTQNLALNIPVPMLQKLDRVGYELAGCYKLGGLSEQRVRLLALAHLIESA